MEPDSVIEDKTIELMVSAALWTVCSSVRPAPGGPAHLSVRREAGPGPSPPSRPRPGPPAFRGLGPGAAPPDPSISQAGPGPAPSMPLGSPPCPRPVFGPISRTTLARLRYGLSSHSLQHLILLFLEWDLLLFFSLFLRARPAPLLKAPLRPNEMVAGGGTEEIGRGLGLRDLVGVSAPSPQPRAVWMPG